jgi:site-specific recombinase XerD
MEERKVNERVRVTDLAFDAESFAGVVEAWIEFLIHDVKRSPRTIKSYRSTVKAWNTWLHDSGVDGSDPSNQDFYAFIQRPQPRSGESYSVVAQRRELVTLSGFYRWCWENGLTDRFLMAGVEVPNNRWQNPSPVPDPLFFNAWSRVLDDNVRVALGLGFWVGLRPIEIVRLRGCDISSEELVAKRKATRGQSREQRIPYATMVDIIVEDQHRQGFDSRAASERWFQLLLKRRAYPDKRVVERCDDGMGVPRAEYLNKVFYRNDIIQAGFTPHKLRHSCATNLLKAGVPLEVTADMLGHTSLETTRGYADTLGSFLSARALRKSQLNDSPYAHEQIKADK